VKLADGSIKKVMRDHALPDPDTIEEQPALSKRAQKRARGERIAEKKALERGEVYVSASAKKKEEAERAQQEEEDRAREESAQAENKKGKGGKAEAQEDRPLTHEEKKMAIADTCSQLMLDPEKNIAALGSLHRFCLDTDQVIVKMALLSEAMVFADILPDYRIRLPTEKEREMKVSKEVAQQRAFESALLASFQRFLQFMEAAGRKAEEEARLLWEGGAHAAVQGCMLAVVVQAMSLLQKRRPSFNFASNILQSLARRADSPVPAIALMAIYLYMLLYPSIYLSIHPSIHLSIYLSFYLSIYLSVLSILLSIYLSDTHTHTHTYIGAGHCRHGAGGPYGDDRG
jgi:hypothetical protein